MKENEFTKGQVETALSFMFDLDLKGLFTVCFQSAPTEFAGKFFSESLEYPELKDKIAELQERNGALVYYVTHETFWFGECYSLLYVSTYPEDWPHQEPRKVGGNRFIVHAYVWNVTDERNSEFGSIVVENQHGMLVRVE